jgi:predicted DNA-binding transcriptional regulator AlpA
MEENTGWIDAKKLAARLDRSVKTIDRSVRKGRLPEPRQLGPKCKREWYWPAVKKFVGMAVEE